MPEFQLFSTLFRRRILILPAQGNPKGLPEISRGLRPHFAKRTSPLGRLTSGGLGKLTLRRHPPVCAWFFPHPGRVPECGPCALAMMVVSCTLGSLFRAVR